MKKSIYSILLLTLAACTSVQKVVEELPLLKVSDNQRYLATENGHPFFWLGDTGWLLFNKLDRAEAETYLEDRKQKGFNVIQAMVLHTVPSVNVYGDTSLVNANIAQPDT